jgi:hypothetical protein
MKNAVFWDIKTQFEPHRRHITSPLQSATLQCYVSFEAFTMLLQESHGITSQETAFNTITASIFHRHVSRVSLNSFLLVVWPSAKYRIF